MVKWVRSGVMEGAPELVADLGGDYRALAREAGVPISPMANPDMPMRVDRFVAFMEIAATTLGEPAFGLRLGPRQTFSLFGPMAPLLGNAPDVRAMMLDLADFFPLHTQGTMVGLEVVEGGLLLTYELSAEVGSQQRQVVELGFSVVTREMRRHDPHWLAQEHVIIKPDHDDHDEADDPCGEGPEPMKNQLAGHHRPFGHLQLNHQERRSDGNDTIGDGTDPLF